MTESYTGDRDKRNVSGGDLPLPDLKIQTSIDSLPEGALNPSLEVKFRFIGKNPIEREYSDDTEYPEEDVDDSWEEDGVHVHDTDLTLDDENGAVEITLASNHKIKAAYETHWVPAPTPPDPPGREKRILWLIITPAEV